MIKGDSRQTDGQADKWTYRQADRSTSALRGRKRTDREPRTGTAGHSELLMLDNPQTGTVSPQKTTERKDR